MDNPWLGRRVISYAHQGGAWEAPSSTLFAIRRALDLGATGIELDVHATADRQLVVCHDASVDRTTDGAGAIASLTLDQLRRLDNAYWFAPGADVTPGLADDQYPYRGHAPADGEFCVATLQEVLALVDAHPGVALNLDIKQTAPTVVPYEAELAAALREFELAGRVIVASFLDAATDAFAALSPGVATSAGTIATAEFVQAVRAGRRTPDTAHVALQIPMAAGGTRLVDSELVAAAHGAGMAVHVWTINDPAAMDELIELGVDGIISDRPAVLVPKVDGRGLRARI